MLKHRLPAISSTNYDGIPMNYGADQIEMARGAASYVDRILRGAKASELPLQFPTTFKLTINVRTAKAIGLTIPQALLATADQVIE